MKARQSRVMNDWIVRHIDVRGRVQGVGFRAFVEDRAIELGLTGWVRNRRDGSVEAVFAGPRAAVDEIVAACRTGPGGARVDALDQRDSADADLGGEPDIFVCRPTV
jgi:acylphosphatase